MRLARRVARATTTVAAAVSAVVGCPGPGVMNRLADDAPDPPPCPVCGGCHVLAIEEVVVEAAEWSARPAGP
jgi:hypothetical protein